ncbi:cartilage matrix protein-like [Ptychodera flava]|uniref:cartilage matrix protein-like n=1 Tax=Ptychodera flava TaxID=63121 RepID=UPI00396AA2C6
MKFTITSVTCIIFVLIYSNCSVRAKTSARNRPRLSKRCRVSEWSTWSSSSRSITGCSTMTRTREILRRGRECSYDLQQSEKKCVRPSAFETANAIGENFLGKFTPSAWLGRLGNVAPPPADLLFVIDKSSSVGLNHFTTLIGHIQELINLFPVPMATDHTRVAAISFSSHDKVDLEFDFTACNTRETCSALVGHINFDAGLTYTTKALIKAREEAFTADHGSRSNAHKVLFLVTDGRSNGHGDILGAANALKDAGTEIYALGVTENINEDELKSIVSEPIPEHLFYYSSFKSLGRGARFLHAMFS